MLSMAKDGVIPVCAVIACLVWHTRVILPYSWELYDATSSKSTVSTF